MNSLKTSGIVIKRMNFGEADRILTILTERFGKVKAIAKGVRKTKSRLAGSLEPFMVLDLQLHEGKSFFIVTGSVIEREFSEVHSNLQKTSQAFYIGEIADKILQENQRIHGVFEIFAEALAEIDVSGSEFLLRIFELRIIEASGFKPELYQCIHCKEKVTPEDNFWDSTEGGIICRSCQQKFHHGKRISDDLIKIFRLIDRGEYDLLKRVNLKKEIEEEAEAVLSEYIKSILERDLKSQKFLKEISR